MKTRMHIILALAFAAITASADPVTSDADPKLSVTRGKQNSIALKADAKGRLTAKTKTKTDAAAAGATITARMKQTTETPFAVKGDPTRPYLVVTNGFEKPIYFRVFAREQGSKESVEVQEIAQPVSFGKNQIVYCFKSGSLVEEVTLSHFSFSKE